MGIFLKLFLIALTITGPFFLFYGGYLLIYGKKDQRVKAILLLVGGLIAGSLAYMYNSLFGSLLF